MSCHVLKSERLRRICMPECAVLEHVVWLLVLVLVGRVAGTVVQCCVLDLLRQWYWQHIEVLVVSSVSSKSSVFCFPGSDKKQVHKKLGGRVARTADLNWEFPHHRMPCPVCKLEGAQGHSVMSNWNVHHLFFSGLIPVFLSFPLKLLLLLFCFVLFQLLNYSYLNAQDFHSANSPPCHGRVGRGQMPVLHSVSGWDNHTILRWEE